MIPIFLQRIWILFLGDIFLILIITRFLPGIRGWHFDIFSVETGASVFTTLTYMLMMYIFDLYNIHRAGFSRDMITRITTATGMSGIISSILFFYLPQWRFGRSIFLIQLGLVWVSLTLWRYCFNRVLGRTADKKPVLIIGSGNSAIELWKLLKNKLSPYVVAGFLADEPTEGKTENTPDILGSPDQLREVAAATGAKTVILAVSGKRSPALIQNLLQARFEDEIDVVEMAKIYEEFMHCIPVEHIDDNWLLYTDGLNLVSRKHLWQLKYMGEFLISSFLLILAFPLMFLISLAIFIDSPGPIFYKQKRVGWKGKIFSILKFRSMVENAENRGPVWAEKDDLRVTRSGRVIRFLRLDELPQLLNILRGEMSLVGPRPERSEFVDELGKNIPYYAVRHSIRPGITGWAQINYPYGASIEDTIRKLEYDFYYIKNMSFFLDIRILLKTIGVILFGQGAR